MLQRKTFFTLVIVYLASSLCFAEDPAPEAVPKPPAAKPAAKAAPAAAKLGPTIGNPDAPVGGTFYRIMDQEPNSLNPLRIQDAYGQEIEGFCFDNLLSRNIETFEYEP